MNAIDFNLGIVFSLITESSGSYPGLTIFSYLVVFFFGACWGSFLNVVIYRLPIGKTVMRPPRSFCPKCETEIAWYDNIPVLSFLLLKRKCRHCKEPISYRYPLIELLTAVLFCLVFLRFGFSVATPIYWILTGCLIAITFIDIDHFIIPDCLSLGLLPIGLLISMFALTWGQYSRLHVTDPIDAVLGMLVGWAVLDIIGEYCTVLLKRDAMGRGDVKLMGMVGTFLGWKLTLLTIPLSSLVGVMFYLPSVMGGKMKRFQEIPYGPFLAMSAFVMMLYGDVWVDWYLTYIGVLEPMEVVPTTF